MPSAFDASNPPFDRLTQEEIGELRAALDIAYLRPGEAVLTPGQKAENLHVIIKGSIEVRDGGTLNAVLGPKDAFDSRALVHGAAGEDFIAAEETLCYLIPRSLVLGLIARNPGFAAFFYSEVSAKLDAFARAHRQEGMESVLRARVREASRGPAVMVSGDATLAEAAARMQDANINAVYVRENGRIGVVTGMNLAKAVLLQRLPLDTPVRQVCHFDVIAVDSEDFIFEALLLMTRHDKRRVAVRTGGNSPASSRTSTSSDWLPAIRSSSPAASTAPAAWRISPRRRRTSRHRSNACTARASRSSRLPRSPRTSTAGFSSSCSTCWHRPPSANMAA